MYQQIARNRRRAAAWMAAFFAIWTGIGALIGWLWANLMSVQAAVAPASADRAGPDLAGGALVAAVLAVAGIWLALRSGTRIILAAAGARPADPDRHRQLHDLIEALALGDGVPVPAVYVIQDPSPNAFATGSSPERAAITVTTGLLAVMDREQLEGVLAHEMSHIKNHDVRLLLVVSTLIGIAGLLAGLVWRWSFLARGRGRNGQQILMLALLAGLLLTALAMLFGPLIRLALSRQRESLADVSGVELTRNPVGLLRALRTLQANAEPMARSNQAIAAMCIDDPRRHGRGRWQHLFDTHPPIEERIAVLERLARVEAV